MIDRSDKAELESTYGIRLVSARILGERRWAAVAWSGEALPIGTQHRIRIDKMHGVIVYGWNKVVDAEQQAVELRIKKWYSKKGDNEQPG